MFPGFIATAGAEDAGVIAKGKELFERKSPNGKSCAGCHVNGKLLENTANKKMWVLMGVKFKRIEDVINLCTENPMGLNSKKHANDSPEMKALKAYIFSFTKK
jgi:cytochrome c